MGNIYTIVPVFEGKVMNGLPFISQWNEKLKPLYELLIPQNLFQMLSQTFSLPFGPK